MKRKFFWVVVAAVLGMVYVNFKRSLREPRRRTEGEELVRWEGEGGNVAEA